MQIRDTLYNQIPYGGGIISYDIVTNDGFGKRHMYEQLRGSPSVIRLVQKGFGVFGRIISKSGICMQKISCLHALYQRQPVLGIPTTATDLVGIGVLRTTGQRLLRRGRQATHEEHRVGAFRS
jgi:hypothetical protein